MAEDQTYAPELISVVYGEDDAVVDEEAAEEQADEEQADDEQADDEQADEEPSEPLPVIDENGVVHLTRTTTKGG